MGRGMNLLKLFVCVAFVLAGHGVTVFADDSNTSIIDNTGSGNTIIHLQDHTHNSVAESIVMGDDNFNIIVQSGDLNEGYQAVTGSGNLQSLFQGFASDINDEGGLTIGEEKACIACLGVQNLDTGESNKQLLVQNGATQMGIQFSVMGLKNRQVMSQSGGDNLAVQTIIEGSHSLQAILQTGTENTAGQNASADSAFQWIKQIGTGNTATQASISVGAVSRIYQSGDGNFAGIEN